MLSLGFGLFMLGRFTGSLLLTWFKPNRLLLIYSISCLALTTLVIGGTGLIGILALGMI